MQYFGLLIPIIFGYAADNIWAGVAVGTALWLFLKSFGIGGSALQKHSEETELKFQDMQAEIDRLKRRLDILERTNSAQTDNRAAAAAFLKTADSSDMQAAAVEPVSEIQTASSPAVQTVPDTEIQTASAAAIQTVPDTEIQTASIPEIQTTANGAPKTVSASEIQTVANGDIQTASAPVHKPEIKPKGKTVYKIAPHQGRVLKNKASAAENGFGFADHPVFAWFLRGNPLLKTGVVVLFLGLAFLLRYASERIHVPVEMRYLTVAAAGFAALVGGGRLQSRKREYGLVLQGFGVAVMYLTALATLKLHPLLPATVVFALMVALVALMAWLSVRQDAQIMAQVAVVGGMAAPVLVSDGSGNYLVLFSYLALLNGGIAAIAWFKAWRPLNLTGFAATFAIAAAWGAEHYTPQHFASVEPFLLYHWLLYTFVAYLFARARLSKNPEDAQPPVADNATLETIWNSMLRHGLRVHVLDHTLLFGTMAAAFALQYGMTEHLPSAGALSALGFAAVYGIAARLLKQSELYILRQAFAALSLVFVTLAVPLYFEQGQTATLWAAEAALVYSFGLHLRRPHVRLGALAVYLLSALMQLPLYETGTETLLQGSRLATLLAALGGAAVYLLWHHRRRKGSAYWEQTLQTAALTATVFYASLFPMLFFAETGSIAALATLSAVWALCQYRQQQTVFTLSALLCGAAALFCQLGADSAGLFGYGSAKQPAALLLYCAVTTAAATYGLHRTLWPSEKAETNLIAGFALIFTALAFGISGAHRSLAHIGLTAWAMPLVFAPFAFAARRFAWKQALWTTLAFTPLFSLHFFATMPESLLNAILLLSAATALHFYILHMQRKADSVVHIISMILIGISWTLFAGTNGSSRLHGVWTQLSWLAAPLAIWAILHTQQQRAFFRRHQHAYLNTCLPLCAAFAAAWLLWVNIAAPHLPAPLPYLPLLNPLELACAGILWFALKSLPRVLPEENRRTANALIVALALTLISAGVMRVWHFYGGIGWQLHTLLQSFGLQASLSVVWAFAAIILMWYGNRRALRNCWISGATLMGAVVVKLFLIELANSGGIERIISFTAVGLLLLLVGWFAPVPPKNGERG